MVVEYEVAVNVYELIKVIGIWCIFLNVIFWEGLCGQEFNVWLVEGGNFLDYLFMVVFIWMLVGLIDFMLGIFNMKLVFYKEESQINIILAYQLVFYVVIYSLVQMVVDLLEYYEDYLVFEFIWEVGVDWEQSKVFNGEVGDYVIIVCQECGIDCWFLGSIIDEQECFFEVLLDFLFVGVNYKVIIYWDGEGVYWDENFFVFFIEFFLVDWSIILKLDLVLGGGIVVILEFVMVEDEECLQIYC